MMADMKKKGAVRQLDELKVEKGKSKKVDKKKVDKQIKKLAEVVKQLKMKVADLEAQAKPGQS